MSADSKIALSDRRRVSAAAAQRTGSRSRVWLIVALLVLGIVALLPRTIGLADFYTIDEAAHWQRRVHLFTEALRQRDWAGTNLTGHPGVTTMWLGSLGRWLAGRAGVGEPGIAGGALYLSYLRLPLAVVNSLAVVLGYLVLRRLLQPGTALLAALLWAASPFLIAHSRLLHLDALVTSCMTLSLLLALRALTTDSSGTRRGLWWLIGAGVGAGCALLTKGSALVLLPVVGLLIAAFAPRVSLRSWLGWVLLRYMVWLGCAFATIYALWPAMWVAPLRSVWSVLSEVIGNGGQPHAWGNYFLGRAVDDPGWLFYPVVVLLRSAPLSLLGLALSPLALIGVRRARSREQLVLLALIGYVLLFALAVSGGAKKFDRYLLPIWPALEIIAALGLVAGVQALGLRLRSRGWLAGSRALVLRTGGTLLLAVLLIAPNLAYHPYYLAYFNPLLGGGSVAQRAMLVGWGEGLEQVGSWLAQRPDLSSGPVLSLIPANLVPFVPQQVFDFDPNTMNDLSSYAVVYARSAHQPDTAEAEAYARQSPPLYQLRHHGIDYASVYQLPRPFTEPIDAVFGDGLHLRGFGVERSADALTLSPSWNVQRSQTGGVFCFIHIIGPYGALVAQVDLPLDDGLFSEWQAGQQFGRPITLPLPPDLAPGTYRVVLGVYQSTTSERLAVTGATPLSAAIDGPQVIQLMEWTLPQ